MSCGWMGSIRLQIPTCALGTLDESDTRSSNVRLCAYATASTPGSVGCQSTHVTTLRLPPGPTCLKLWYSRKTESALEPSETGLSLRRCKKSSAKRSSRLFCHMAYSMLWPEKEQRGQRGREKRGGVGRENSEI